MIAICAKCGKEIYIPNGWTLTADNWRSLYCQDCGLKIEQEREEK